MVRGCGNKCVKNLVFIFNFLVFVVGIAILATALSVRFSNDAQKYFQDILNKNDAGVNLSQMYIALYILMGIGGLLILTGFLGCCGAWQENTCMLTLFFVIILILFISELACGIALLVGKEGFQNSVFDAISSQIGKYNSLPQEQQTAITNMQTELNCCGCYNVTDYLKGGQEPQGSTCSDPATINTGCCTKIWDGAKSQIAIVGGVAVGILVIELLAMIFSCILCQAFRHADYQYA